ncbi:collagen-like protein [Micromonospora okii]|uniref:collagen-like protein n=1 Tax=Micromonospora okii TaxID=1182970 RepID=UPI001E376C14|nr:collagen-like protein [Micromonospora okii]
MSNYLRKNDDTGKKKAAGTRGRRKVWLVSGVAGLTGVVSLAAIGVGTSAGAAGMDRLTDLTWSTAEQFVKGDGGSGRGDRNEHGDRGKQDERGEHGDRGEQGEHGDRGEHGNRDERGEHGNQGKQGDRGEHGGKEQGHGKGKEQGGKGENDKEQGGQGQNGSVQAVEVSCNADRLIAAITRANADNGGTLKLAKGCTYSLTVNNGPGGSGLPPITQNITITGEDTTLTRAANAASFRFFDVAPGGHLRLSNTTLTGGNGPTGAAILVRTGGVADITNATLVNNDATTTGGAIHNEGTTTVTNTTIRNNSATQAGGGIHNTGLLTLTETKIHANVAGAAGGGINNLAGTLTTTKSALNGNRSVGAGGGIASERGIVDITDTELTDNTTGVTGGGIGALNTQLVLRNTTITRNASVGGGGGIANTATLLLTSSTVIENSKITENFTNGLGGGGILNHDLTPATGGTATLTLRNTETSRNKATLGGGIRNINGTITLNRTTIATNTALTNNGGGGGIHTNVPITAVDPSSTVGNNRPNHCTGTVTNCFG